MHLTEDSYRRLQAGEDFPGAEELARHLDTSCAECEAFLGDRKPASTIPSARPPSNSGAARLPRSMRAQNLALMLTDIKGYTERTSRQTRAENERLLRIHEALMLPVFRAFNGVVRKEIGDAFLVTFESPTNAVLCGVAIQDRLFTFNQTAPEPDRMEVRVVVNIGEVRIEPNDVFGEPVQMAKGVEAQAEANEVTLTEAVFLVMNKAEVPSVELGQFELAGVPEKVRLFKVPRGGGRLTSGPAPVTAGASMLPFGGLGLARAGNLPETDLPTIERALHARQSRRALVAQAQQFLRSPTGLKSVAAVGGVLLLGAAVIGVKIARTPAVERAIEGGELSDARVMIDKMPEGGERTYWSGRLEEKRGKLDDAITQYLGAARDSQKWLLPSVERLGVIARTGDCHAKVRVADELGKLGDPAGKSVLEGLMGEKAETESGVIHIFDRTCDPADHARKALDKLASK